MTSVRNFGMNEIHRTTSFFFSKKHDRFEQYAFVTFSAFTSFNSKRKAFAINNLRLIATLTIPLATLTICTRRSRMKIDLPNATIMIKKFYKN